MHETVWSREGRASCEIGYVWGEHMTAQDTHTREKRQQGDVIQSDPEQSVFLASGLANPLKASFTQITKSTFLSCL